MTKIQKIYIGADHVGYELKNEIKKYVVRLGFDTEDVGVFSGAAADYPDIAKKVAKKVLRNRAAYGILICGTGIGMSMAANRFKNIRAAECASEKMAEFSRKHNDANVLCLGARLLKPMLAKKITRRFLQTNFESETRHILRVKKIELC